MKILFCTMQFGPGYNQGTERYIRNLARDLCAMGCDVVVAAGDPDGILKDAQEGDCKGVQRLTLPTFGWTTVNGDSIENSKRLLSQLKPDIVHMVNPGHIGVNLPRAATELGIPYLVSVTDFWWLCPKQTLTLQDGSLCGGFAQEETCLQCIAHTHRNKLIRLSSKLEVGRIISSSLIRRKHQPVATDTLWGDRKSQLSEVLHAAKSVICLSRTGERLLKDYYGLKNCRYIPAGLAPMWFDRRQHERNKNKLFTIGFIGAIAPHKGLHVLTKALHSLKDDQIQLKIAGKCAALAYAEKEFLRFPNTQYLGHLSEEEARSLMDSLDAVVLPSLWPENQPQVLLEAGARGIPVIASDIPGCAELLGTEALFPMNDHLKLGQMIAAIKRRYTTLAPPPKALSSTAVATRVLTEYQKVI